MKTKRVKVPDPESLSSGSLLYVRQDCCALRRDDGQLLLHLEVGDRLVYGGETCTMGSGTMLKVLSPKGVGWVEHGSVIEDR